MECRCRPNKRVSVSGCFVFVRKVKLVSDCSFSFLGASRHSYGEQKWAVRAYAIRVSDRHHLGTFWPLCASSGFCYSSIWRRLYPDNPSRCVKTLRISCGQWEACFDKCRPNMCTRRHLAMLTMLGDVMPPLHEDTSPTMLERGFPDWFKGSENSIEPRGRGKVDTPRYSLPDKRAAQQSGCNVGKTHTERQGRVSLSTLPKGEIRNGASRLVGSRY